MENLKIQGTITTTPNDEDIRKAEEELGLTFPPSYKNFVKRFGNGVLCSMFLIYVPNSMNENLDLVKKYTFEKDIIQQNVEGGLWDDAAVDKNWLLSLTPFGSSQNGDILCWDTNQKSESGEYNIYLLDNEQNGTPLVARSMNEFVEEFCINQKIDEIYPVGQGEKWNLPNTFEPL